jgi:hypothetical protein
MDLLVHWVIISTLWIHIVREQVLTIDWPSNSRIRVAIAIGVEGRFTEVSGYGWVCKPSTCRLNLLDSLLHLFLLFKCVLRSSWLCSFLLLFHLLLGLSIFIYVEELVVKLDVLLTWLVKGSSSNSDSILLIQVRLVLNVLPDHSFELLIHLLF